MRILALTSLLGLGLVAVGCGDNGGAECGAGTHLEGDVCVADPDADMAMLPGAKTTCGTNQVENSAKVCELTNAACKSGTVLTPDKFACELNVNHGSLVAGPYTMDRIWNFLRYNNNGSLAKLGDFTTLTAMVPDDTEIYMAGIGGPPNTDPAKADKLGKHAPLPTFWDSNPSVTTGEFPIAQQEVITVGKWKTCTMTYAIYSNPPREDMKKWYRVVVDAAGCPADTSLGLWFQYSDTKYVSGRILSNPAGGTPNMMFTDASGKAHWERDLDPEVWFKYGVSLHGSTHGKSIVPATGRIPNMSADASFSVAAFVHNDGQSNGNAGWCYVDPITNTICGQTATIGGPVGGGAPTASKDNSTLANVKSYVYQPGKVGYDAFPAFGAGSVDGVSTNTAPLSVLQPY